MFRWTPFCLWCFCMRATRKEQLRSGSSGSSSSSSRVRWNWGFCQYHAGNIFKHTHAHKHTQFCSMHLQNYFMTESWAYAKPGIYQSEPKSRVKSHMKFWLGVHTSFRQGLIVLQSNPVKKCNSACMSCAFFPRHKGVVWFCSKAFITVGLYQQFIHSV